MAVTGRLYKVNELVQVESVDAGFEAAHFEAVVQKMLSVAPAAEGAGAAAVAAEPSIMYDVKYARFVSAAGKPIVEAACEARIRPVPPELTGYEPSLGDYVEAFWRDGWWEGTVVKLDADGGDGENKCLVRFPEHSSQEIWLSSDDLRPRLELRAAEGPWYRKIRKADGDAAAAAAAAVESSEWIALDPMTHKLRLQSEPPKKKRPASVSTVRTPRPHLIPRGTSER